MSNKDVVLGYCSECKNKYPRCLRSGTCHECKDKKLKEMTKLLKERSEETARNAVARVKNNYGLE